jgi:Tfp pilus assembly protein PilF
MENTNRPGGIPDRRLDSWKEIALFFNKDARTVRRWEKERSLPVHRAQGKPGGSVYAFTHELTEWLNSPSFAEEERAASLERTPEETAVPPRSVTNTLVAGVFLLALLVGAAAIWRHYSRSAALPASAKTSDAHRSGSTNPEAVDLYLKGRYEWSKRSPESLNKAVDFFMQAIVRDPNYAEAYAGLADTYDLLREYTVMPSSEAYPRAIAAAKKAVELDDSLSEAHRALAFATFYWTWDFAAGEREFKRAIDLNPKDAVAHHWYGTALGALGRFTEGLSELEQARALDPGSASIQADRAFFLCYMQRDAEGVALLRQIEAGDPSFISPHRYLAFLAILKGDYVAYLAESRKAADLAHDQTGLEIAKAAERGFANGGGKSLLENIRPVEGKFYEQGLISGVYVAEICSLSGKDQDAMQYLQEAFTKHDPTILGIRFDPALNSLHDETAFRELVLRIGLPPL